MRLVTSFVAAAALHGAVFGVAAVVLARATPGLAPRPVPLDVELIAARAEPLADAPPSPPPPQATPTRPPRHRATARSRHPLALVQAAVRTEPTASPTTAPRDDTPAPAPALSPPARAEPPVTTAPGAGRVSAGRSPRAAVLSAPSSGVVSSAHPRYRSNPKPDYPIASRRRREEGIVLLSVVVQPDGLPAAITLFKSSGHPLLDRAALQAVRRWIFEPGRAAGVAVSSRVVVPVRFSLSEEP